MLSVYMDLRRQVKTENEKSEAKNEKPCARAQGVRERDPNKEAANTKAGPEPQMKDRSSYCIRLANT